MKLLFETTNPADVAFNDMSVIFENKDPNKPSKLTIKGKFICCNKTNVNGRVYDFKYMKDVCVPEYKKTWIDTGRAYAELNHAQSHVVNVKDACELTTSLEPCGTDFIGESIVLCSDSRLGTPGTPNGDILASILLHGGKIGKSTRGAVEDPNNKTIDYDNPYTLICVDTVLDPSGPGCYVDEIAMESKDYMVNEYGIVVECAYDQFEKRLKNNYKSSAIATKRTEQIQNAFAEFLNNIRG